MESWMVIERDDGWLVFKVGRLASTGRVFATLAEAGAWLAEQPER